MPNCNVRSQFIPPSDDGNEVEKPSTLKNGWFPSISLMCGEVKFGAT